MQNQNRWTLPHNSSKYYQKKNPKTINAFISNEPQQLFLDVVKIMKPNNALPGIFLCLKFGSP